MVSQRSRQRRNLENCGMRFLKIEDMSSFGQFEQVSTLAVYCCSALGRFSLYSEVEQYLDVSSLAVSSEEMLSFRFQDKSVTSWHDHLDMAKWLQFDYLCLEPTQTDIEIHHRERNEMTHRQMDRLTADSQANRPTADILHRSDLSR